MKRIALVLTSCLMALSLVMASCAKETTTTTTTTTTPPVTTNAPLSTTPVAGGKWWGKFGEPQYGGKITTATLNLPSTFDPANFITSGTTGFFDMLFIWDWTVDRSEYPFKTFVVPQKYIRGMLAETWEWQDPQTLIVHLRKDVYFQNKPPANGRKLTAQDVEFHYDRMMGTGQGYTQPNTFSGGLLNAVQKVTALDDYTVQAKFKQASALNNFNALANPGSQNEIELPEAVKQYGPVVSDWRYAVGTGPFIVTDYVSGSSMTLSRNPNYWGHDERYPQNQLPYVDTFRVLSIPDVSTRGSALRTGKIDVSTGVQWEQAEELTKGNPDLEKAAMPVNAYALELRVDKDPFKDIRVRKALNMAVNREELAKTYWGGTVDGKPAGLFSPYSKGYAFPYSDWPQQLKDEYSYNPERAKQLLAEAGFPKGFKTNVVAGNTETDQDIVAMLQTYFAAINVDMEIRPMESVAFQNFVTAAKQDQMDFRNWWAMYAPVDVPLGLFYSKTPRTSGVYVVADDKYDALVDQFKGSKTEDEAQGFARDAEKYALEQHWTVGLFPLVDFNLWQPYVKGYSGELIFIFQAYWYWTRLWTEQGLAESMGR